MGSRILAGRYELLEKIGEGGMAIVFKSKDRLLNRNVAIKILRPEYTKDMLFIESFRRESQLAASIVDPNIVNVYDVGKEGNIYYIVMELVEGKPLSEVIKEEGPLEPKRVVNIARQIAMALSTAHKHQLIHRDVKPHNVLMTSSDVAKISDFGIAKVVTNDTLVGDEKEAVMGSIHYFSPEQARGAYVDERSDIYSLGIVMYEMVTGQVPFDGDSAVAVAIMHMNEPMVPPSRLVPTIPQDLENIIMKATAKLQTDRYKTADELITDLSFVKISRLSDYYYELEKSESEENTANQRQVTTPSRNKQDKEGKDKNREKLSLPGFLKGKKQPKDETSNKGNKAAETQPGETKSGKEALEIAGRNTSEAEAIRKKTEAEKEKRDAEKARKAEDAAKKAEEKNRKEEAKAKKEEARAKKEDSRAQKTGEREKQADFETPEERRKNRNKIIVMLSIIAVIVIAVIVAVSKIQDYIDQNASKEIEMPSIVNMTMEEASAFLKDYQMTVEVELELTSSRFEAGRIMSQNPEAGLTVKEGQIIKVYLSKGSSDPSVPRLTGITRAAASNTIISSGYVLGEIKEAYDSLIPKGSVVSQSPEAGTKLAAGQPINIVVSLGPENPEEIVEISVPSVMRQSLKNAKSTITDTGLVVGEINYQPSTTVEKDVVISQSPVYGTKLQKGEAVNLVVSSGAPEIKKISVTVDFSAAEEDTFKLTVNYTDGSGVQKTAVNAAERTKASGSETVTAEGYGSGSMTVLFDDKTVATYTLNFDAGTAALN